MEQTEFHGSRHDREPQWLGDWRARDDHLGGGGARGGAGLDRPASGGRRRITLGADKAYDIAAVVDDLRGPCRHTPYRRAEPPRQDRQATQNQDRPPRHAPPRRRRQPADAKAERGGVRLGQGHWRTGQNHVPGPATVQTIQRYPEGRRNSTRTAAITLFSVKSVIFGDVYAFSAAC